MWAAGSSQRAGPLGASGRGVSHEPCSVPSRGGPAHAGDQGQVGGICVSCRSSPESPHPSSSPSPQREDVVRRHHQRTRLRAVVRTRIYSCLHRRRPTSQRLLCRLSQLRGGTPATSSPCRRDPQGTIQGTPASSDTHLHHHDALPPHAQLPRNPSHASHTESEGFPSPAPCLQRGHTLCLPEVRLGQIPCQPPRETQ